MQRLFQLFLAAAALFGASASNAASRAWLDTKRAEPDVVSLPSGLMYK